MLKIFWHSFSLSNLFKQRKKPLKAFIAYFLFLVLVIAFPLNYQIIKNDGFRGLNTITYELRKANPQWLPEQLPSDMSISQAGLHFIQNQEYRFMTTTEAGVFTIIINPQTPASDVVNTIVLGTEQISFFDGQGHSLLG
ncbi:MAG TPA: hypothetical protein PKG91_05985, partial [Bacilli bacterium]|nr:hypothetical protein [Bacilli bacterium]